MATIQPASDIAMQRIAELSETAVAEHRDSILPIYGSKHNGNPTHIGTAIALNLYDQKLLLTAAHVVDQNEITSLYVGGAALTLLETEFHCSAKRDNDRNRDHYDFAIARLPTETVEALDGISYFSESSICNTNVDPLGTTFTIAGYPNSQNKKFHVARHTVNAELYHYSNVGRPNPFPDHIPHYSATTHIFLNYDQKHSQDAHARRINSIELTGMSGGPLFNIGRLTDPAVLAKHHNPKRAWPVWR